MRANRFKNALKQGRTVFGMAVYSYSPTLVEVIGHSGFDFIFLDSEHTPLGVDTGLEHLVRAADVSNTSVILRIKGNDEHLIRNAFEMGVDGIVIPHMKDKEDAEKAVKSAKFPPSGIRGAAAEVRAANYGAGDFNWVEYIKKSNEDTVVIGLAEDKEFFENMEDILSVEGLDMINFGPTDLAMSLGLSLLYQMDDPQIQEAFEKLIAKSKENNISIMCPAAPPTFEQAQKLIKQGVRAIILRNDIVNFKNICQQFVRDIIHPLRKKG